MLKHNISDNSINKWKLKKALKYGIIDQILCSVGFKDEKTGNYSVSYCFVAVISLNFRMLVPNILEP